MVKFILYHKKFSHLDFLFFLLFSGLAIVVTGCESTPKPVDLELVDQSFITDQTCEAPCWYGLEPGKSNETEVLDVLKKQPFVNQSMIETRSNVGIDAYKNASEISYGCASPIGSTCGFISSVNGTVIYISVIVQYPLSLRSVINRLGAPDYIFYSPNSPHGDGCRVTFNWTQKRISTVGLDQTSQRICLNLDEGKGLDPDLQIIELNYKSEDIALQNYCDHMNCKSWPGYIEE